jgi:hypothetical protein
VPHHPAGIGLHRGGSGQGGGRGRRVEGGWQPALSRVVSDEGGQGRGPVAGEKLAGARPGVGGWHGVLA